MSEHGPGRRSMHDRQRPVARFLGEEHAGGGPFALLGLSPEACSEDLVLAALDRQIEKVTTHSECDTPEADEVRLALHAAAAQLLDPVVRRHLVSRWMGKAVPRPAVAAGAGTKQSVSVSAAGSRTAAERRLEHDAILTLGLYGGWNARALRRLVSLAHARGLGNEQVVATLRNLSNRRAGSATRGAVVASANGHPAIDAATPANGTVTRPTGSAGPRPAGPQPVPFPSAGARIAAPARGSPAPTPSRPPLSSEPLPAERDPAERVLKNALLFGGIGLLGLVVTLGAIFLATRSPATPPAPMPGPTSPVAKGPAGPGPSMVPPAPAPAPERPAPKPRPRTEIAADDPLLSVQEMATIAEMSAVSPEEATERFERLAPKLAMIWPQLPRDRQVAITDSILEFLYRVSGSTALAMRGVDAVAVGARALGEGTVSGEGVLPAAWSSGVLVRLSRERDLPATAKVFIEREIAGALGIARPAVEQTFEAGVLAAMYVLPQRMTPVPGAGARPDAVVDEEAWSAFARAAAAMPADDAVRTRVLLTGLETLLTEGPEPNESRSVAGVVTELISKLPWRQGDETRRSLLRWFADSRFTNADMNAVTTALATKSAAEGIDITMVLSTSAAPGVRADLRERYATVWGLQDTIGRDELLADWAMAAREAIAQSYMASDDVGELASAALLARLNEAALWHWKGDTGEAGTILDTLHDPISDALADARGMPTGDLSVELSDGSWGERYLGVRNNIKVRRELLSELENRGELGPIDAEVLVGEALVGSPQDLRQRAQEIAKRFSTEPAVINAVLERLPRTPKVPSNAGLIEVVAGTSLPSVRDPDWEMRARRALVERLLEAVAEESPQARVERLGRVLRVSYRSMSAQAPLSEGDRAAPAQPAGAQSAGQVWRAWRALADKAIPSVAAPVPLPELERRHEARAGQAVGMIQEFAAEEASLMEVLSYLAAAEQPASIEEVRLVVSEAAAARRRSKHLFEQMNAAERAMTQLWLLRFGHALKDDTEVSQ